MNRFQARLLPRQQIPGHAQVVAPEQLKTFRRIGRPAGRPRFLPPLPPASRPFLPGIRVLSPLLCGNFMRNLAFGTVFAKITDAVANGNQ
jgi:hypothetical protein